MFICKGKVVGMNQYSKDGKTNYYAQVVYTSKIDSFSGERAVSVKVSEVKKIGSEIRICDDLLRPQAIEE